MKLDELITDVYEVYEHQQTEPVGVFATYELAYNASKGKGMFGTYGLIKGVKGIVLGETVFVLKYAPVKINVDTSIEKKKEIDNILSKLTPEEIQKLNIDRTKHKIEESTFDSQNIIFNIPA
jgi:hypothetical protein